MKFRSLVELIEWLDREIDCGGSPENWALADALRVHLEPARASLEEAWRLTHGDRKSSYGAVQVSFARYAKVWSGLLGAKLKEDLTASDVALLMAALKLVRESNKQQSDNVVDAHGYLILHDEIKQAEAKS